MSQSSRVAKNVLITLATQLLTWGLSFAVTLFLPRYLKDFGLGAVTLGASVAGLLQVIVGLGTSTVLTKEIARDHSRLASLSIAGIVSRIPLAIIAFALGWAIIAALHYSGYLAVLIYLSIGAMVVGQFADVLTCALRGVEDFPRQNAIAVVEKVINSGALIALVFGRGPVWAIVAAGILSSAANLILSILAVRKHVVRMRQSAAAKPSSQWKIDTSGIRLLIYAGMPFLTSAIFTAVYGQSDALLLSKLSTVAAIGWYGLAKRLGGSTLVIPTTVCATLLPLMVRLHEEDKERFQTIVRKMFDVMVISVIPFAAILILAPGQILLLLHYPASFQHSIPVLVIMGSGVALWFLSQAAGTALIACDRQAIFGRVAGIAALASVPLCGLSVYLTERYMANGAIGAILSDVLLEAYMVTAYILALPPGLFDRGVLSVFGRAALAALPMVGLFYFVHDRSGIYLPLIGLVAYVPLCKVFGCIGRSDINLLMGAIRRKSGAY